MTIPWPYLKGSFFKTSLKSKTRRGGRHENLVGTLTLTQCDPPLKNPGYAYGGRVMERRQEIFVLACEQSV